jgi:hypothetical protein
MKIRSLGPDAEVLGGAINGFIDAINRDKIMPHLEKLGMTNIEPNKWYPKQMYIDLWNSILESGDSTTQNFVSVGMTIADTAWPPEADEQSFDALIASWNDAFDTVNRGEDRGYVWAEKNHDKLYTVRCRTPDPDDLNYGVVYGFCRRFLPEATEFNVLYDPDVQRRDEGGEETVILIELD